MKGFPRVSGTDDHAPGNNVGPMLLAAIKERGEHWNQALLSKQTGYSEKHISQIIRGVSQPSVVMMVDCARVLGKDPDWVMAIMSEKLKEDINGWFCVTEPRDEKAPEGS